MHFDISGLKFNLFNLFPMYSRFLWPELLCCYTKRSHFSWANAKHLQENAEPSFKKLLKDLPFKRETKLLADNVKLFNNCKIASKFKNIAKNVNFCKKNKGFFKASLFEKNDFSVKEFKQKK